jgi:hypothetical protein
MSPSPATLAIQILAGLAGVLGILSVLAASGKAMWLAKSGRLSPLSRQNETVARPPSDADRSIETLRRDAVLATRAALSGVATKNAISEFERLSEEYERLAPLRAKWMSSRPKATFRNHVDIEKTMLDPIVREITLSIMREIELKNLEKKHIQQDAPKQMQSAN